MLVICSQCASELEVADAMGVTGGTTQCPQCKYTITLQPSGDPFSPPPNGSGAAAAAMAAPQAMQAPQPVQAAPQGSAFQSTVTQAPAPQASMASVAGPQVAAPPESDPQSAPAESADLPAASPRGGVSPAMFSVVVAVLLLLTIGAWFLGSSKASGESAEDDKKTLQTKIEELQKQLKQVEAEKKSLKANGETFETKIKSLEQEKAGLDEKVRELQRKVDFIALWQRPEFVMINPAHFAVGLDFTPDSGFHVLAKAENELAAWASQIAMKSGVPRIGHDKQLTREIHGKANPGDYLPQELADRVNKLWAVHRFVPPAPEDPAPKFVSFLDSEYHNQARLGFFVGLEGDKLLHRPVGPKTETILKARIVAGTAKMAEGDRIKRAQEIDYLDFVMLNVAHRIQSLEDQPGRCVLAISVDTDLLQEILDYSKRPDDTWIDDWFDFHARYYGEKFRWDTRKIDARYIRRARDVLEDEIYEKAFNLGLPLVERENIEMIHKERGLPGTRGFEPKVFGELLCASHVLTVNVDHATEGGLYRVAARLVNADNGKVLFADNGDRFKVRDEPPAAFLLDSGDLVLAKFRGNAGVLPPAEGKPMVLPPIGKIEEQARLGYIEYTSDPAIVRFRDILDKKFQDIALSEFEGEPRRVTDIEQLPRPYQMRFLMWQIGRSVAPLANRVTVVEGNAAKIGLTKGQVNEGDRFKVVRVNSTPGLDPRRTLDAKLILPMELVVQDVDTTGGSRVYISNSDVEYLWPEQSTVEEDDIVIRKGARAARVAVVMPGVDLALIDPDERAKWKTLRAGQQQAALEAANGAAREFAGLVRRALTNMNIDCIADSPEILFNKGVAAGTPDRLGKAVGATHVVYGRMSPKYVGKQATTYTFEMQVTHSDGGVVTGYLPRKLSLSATQLRDWRP